MAIVSMSYAEMNPKSADQITYDNTISGLTGDNVQDAIDEMNTIENAVANVLYCKGIPISATAVVNVYIDATNGSDATGDGTQANPFKTFEYANARVPHSSPYNVNMYFSGNFSSQGKITISGFTGVLNCLDFGTAPTFSEVLFNACSFVRWQVHNSRMNGTSGAYAMQIYAARVRVYYSHTIICASGKSGISVTLGGVLLMAPQDSPAFAINGNANGIVVDGLSSASCNNCTFTGIASGNQYIKETGSTLVVNGTAR